MTQSAVILYLLLIFQLRCEATVKEAAVIQEKMEKPMKNDESDEKSTEATVAQSTEGEIGARCFGSIFIC